MTTTILEKNLQRLINDYDEETKKAGIDIFFGGWS